MPETTSSPAPQPKHKMPLCNCWLKINKNDDVHKKNVTPMEMLFLVADFHSRVGGNPIHGIEVLKETADRDANQELQRLSATYSDAKLTKLFPGAIAQDVPSFDRAQELGTKMTLGKSKLIDHRLA